MGHARPGTAEHQLGIRETNTGESEAELVLGIRKTNTGQSKAELVLGGPREQREQTDTARSATGQGREMGRFV